MSFLERSSSGGVCLVMEFSVGFWALFQNSQSLPFNWQGPVRLSDGYRCLTESRALPCKPEAVTL